MDEPTNDPLKTMTEHAEDLALLGSLCSSLVLLPLDASESEEHIRERIYIALMMHGVDNHHPYHRRLSDALFDHFVVERWKIVRGLVALGDDREKRGKKRHLCPCLLCNSIAEADRIYKGEAENKAGLEHSMPPEVYPTFVEQNQHMISRILEEGVREGKKKLDEGFLRIINQGTARLARMLGKIYNQLRPKPGVAQVQEMLKSMGLDPETIDVQVIDLDELMK